MQFIPIFVQVVRWICLETKSNGEVLLIFKGDCGLTAFPYQWCTIEAISTFVHHPRADIFTKQKKRKYGENCYYNKKIRRKLLQWYSHIQPRQILQVN